MQNLCSNKFIFKIITDNGKVFMDQVPENDVAILKSKVGDDVIVERAGYQYNMNIGDNFNMTFSNLHLADETEVAGNISNNSAEL